MPKFPVAVAASSRIAADAGAATGGNAVDAAVAAAMVSACTDVGIMSLAGGGFVTVWPPGSEPVVIDGDDEMPGRGKPPGRRGQAIRRVRFDYGGPMETGVGFGAVATPGFPAALSKTAEQFGSKPWRDLLQPAIDWTARGFPLTGAAAEYLGFTHDAVYGWDPESRSILHDARGRPLRTGDIVEVPHLADTLRELADLGVETLYGGDLGRRIAHAVQQAGGLLDIEDLAAYRAQTVEPIRVSFGDWEIVTVPPPSVGGVCLAAMLCLLDASASRDFDAVAVRQLADIQHAVLGFRRARLDSANGALPERVMTLLALADSGDIFRLHASPSTIHVSAVDADGLACSITGSAGYGSGAIVPGTGLWLNNSLGETDLHPDGAAAIEPGTRLASNMAPAIARRGDGAVLAIGSPGASRITTATVQVLLQHLRYGRSLADAVSFPRLHVELDGEPARVAHEPGLPVSAGNRMVPRPFAGPDMYFGGVNAAGYRPAERPFAIADDRRGGCVALAD